VVGVDIIDEEPIHASVERSLLPAGRKAGSGGGSIDGGALASKSTHQQHTHMYELTSPGQTAMSLHKTPSGLENFAHRDVWEASIDQFIGAMKERPKTDKHSHTSDKVDQADIKDGRHPVHASMAPTDKSSPRGSASAYLRDLYQSPSHNGHHRRSTTRAHSKHTEHEHKKSVGESRAIARRDNVMYLTPASHVASADVVSVSRTEDKEPGSLLPGMSRSRARLI